MADDTQRLLILVEAQTAQVNRALKKLERDTASTTAKVRRNLDQLSTAGIQQKIAGGLGTFAKGFIGAFTAQRVVQFVGETIKAMDDLGDAAGRLGVSAEQLQKWKIAAEDLGGSAEDVAPALDFLSRQIGKAASGDKGAVKVFEDLGIAVRDAQGNVRSLADIFNDTADAIAKLGSEEERVAATTELMGRSAGSLAAVFAHGADAIEDIGEEAKKAGQIWDDELIAKADRLDKIWRDLTKSAAANFGKWGVLAADAMVDVLRAMNVGVQRVEAAVEDALSESATERADTARETAKASQDDLALAKETLATAETILKLDADNLHAQKAKKMALEDITRLTAEQAELTEEQAEATDKANKAVEKMLPAWKDVKGLSDDVLTILRNINDTLNGMPGLGEVLAPDAAAVTRMKDAEDFLKRWESAGHSGKPLLKAFFDTNAPRVGFSSDTYVDEMGKVQTTTRDTVITVEQAIADLHRRIAEGTRETADLVGEAWTGLPERVKAALVTIEYHYGSVANAGHVLAAAQTGDVDTIIDAIERLDPAGAKYGARYAELVQFIKGGSIEVAAAAAEYEKLTEAEDKKAEADKKATEALAAFNSEMELHAARIALEKTLLGESIAERERQLAIFDALAAAKERLDRPLSGEEQAQIVAMVNGYNDLAAAKQNNITWSDALRDAELQAGDERLARLEAIKDVWQQIGDTVADAFVSAIIEGEKLEDVLKNLVKQLASMFLRNAISSVFGGIFGGGAGGGLVAAPMVARTGGFAPTAPSMKGAAVRMAVTQAPIKLAVVTTASPYFDTRVAAVSGAVSTRQISAYDRAAMPMMRSREMRGIT